MKRNKIILCADFETTGEEQFLIENETRVYLYHFRDLKEEIKVYGINIQDFFNQVVAVTKELSLPKATIYFHNLSFDGSFILYYLYENYVYKEKINKEENEELENNEFCAIIDDFRNIYQIEFKIDDVLLEFRDSYRLIPTSIEQLGKAFGLPKLNETHNYTEFKLYKKLEDVPDEEIKYITNDVRILVKAVQYMIKEQMSGLTFSSSSYANLKRRCGDFFEKYLTKPQNQAINDAIDLSCKGGFTNYNPLYRNKIVQNVISFDYNSLYPAVMLEDEMPYGEPIMVEDEQDFKKYPLYKLHLYTIYINEVTCNYDSIPFIGLKKNIFGSSYDYPRLIQDKVIVLWEDEFNLFKNNYMGDYEVTSIILFKSRRFLFKNFLEDKIKTKEEASAKIHELEKKKDSMDEEEYIDQMAMLQMKKRVAKLYMNGVSGKFGMRDTRYSSIISGYNRDGSLMYDEEETKCDYYYRAIYSKITSGGRCRLIRHIEENYERVLYWDTDSIYLLGKDIPLSIKANCDDNKIGALKYEGHYKRMKVIKAKCYIKELDSGEIVRSIAGATNEIKEQIDFDNFNEGLTFKGSKHCLHRVKGGAIIESVDFSIGVVDDVTFLL